MRVNKEIGFVFGIHVHANSLSDPFKSAFDGPRFRDQKVKAKGSDDILPLPINNNINNKIMLHHVH